MVKEKRPTPTNIKKHKFDNEILIKFLSNEQHVYMKASPWIQKYQLQKTLLKDFESQPACNLCYNGW